MGSWSAGVLDTLAGMENLFVARPHSCLFVFIRG